MCIENRDHVLFTAVTRKLFRYGKSSHSLLTSSRPRDKEPFLFNAALDTLWMPGAPGESIFYKVHTSDALSSMDGKPEPYRCVTLRCEDVDTGVLFAKQALEEYREHCQALRMATGGDCLGFLEYDECAAEWECVKEGKARHTNTLFLPGNQLELCLEDATAFLNNQPMYEALHVSPIRVYLFKGAPGAGKTSLIHCIASTLNKNIAQLRFHNGTTDADVRQAVTSLPHDAVLCLEDIDALFGESRKATNHGASFASLLATLDGANNPPGRPLLVFMTTNLASTLDPAVRRRVDYVVQFENATKEQCRKMHDVFFPDSTARFDALWAALLKSVHGTSFPCSTMHKFFVKCLHKDPMECLDMFSVLVDCVHTSTGQDMFV